MDPITIAMGLAQFAPTVIKWITGSDKAAEAADAVVNIAKEVTGKADPVDALGAIRMHPDVAVQFRLALQAQEADLDKAFLADRQDARKMSVERSRSDAGARADERRKNAMIIGDVVGLVICLVAIGALGFARAKYPEAISEGVFGALLAQLTTIASIFGLCLRDAHQFEFGSSRGSETKTAMLAK